MTTIADGCVVASTDGLIWDMAPGRPTTFKLLCDETDGKIAVFEEVVPPGVGTPLHIHRTAEELIYILTGEFTVRLGDEFKKASGGAWIFVPRGLAHAWRNTGHEDGQAFFIFTPGDGAKAVEGLRFLGKPILEIEPTVRDEIWQRHGTEFITRDWM